MKNLLAAFVATSLLASTTPGSATEATFALRGVETVASSTVRPVPSNSTTEVAPVRKVRVVLGSPYGN